MNLVAVFDMIAFFGFAGSLIVVCAFAGKTTPTPEDERRSGGTDPACHADIVLRHVLQLRRASWHHVESGLVEDFVGILFFPLLGYAYYLIWVDQRMKALWAAVATAQAEHQMLLSILDSIQAAAVLIDSTGRITFANEYARTLLELPLGEHQSYMTGTAPSSRSDAGQCWDRDDVRRSVLGRTIKSEHWEYVVGDVRTTLELSAGSMAAGAGGDLSSPSGPSRVWRGLWRQQSSWTLSDSSGRLL